jgi:hypothetical protein
MTSAPIERRNPIGLSSVSLGTVIQVTAYLKACRVTSQ